MGILKSTISVAGTVSGISPAARAAGRISQRMSGTVADIAGDAGQAADWIKSDLTAMKHAIESRNEDVILETPENAFRRHMRAAGHIRSDLPRLLTRSAQSVWSNMIFGFVLIVTGIFFKSVIFPLVAAAVLLAASKHAWRNWMYRNEKFIGYLDFLKQSDYLPKTK